jgi:Putative stress-responsive transcriptional regulator
MNKQLFKSRSNKVIAGVCGGIGECFNVDPTIIRIIWAICFFSGVGLLAYIVAAIIIPEEGSANTNTNTSQDFSYNQTSSGNANLIIGGILVVLGIILIGRHFFFWLDSGLVWSLILIAAGAFIIFRGWRR